MSNQKNPFLHRMRENEQTACKNLLLDKRCIGNDGLCQEAQSQQELISIALNQFNAIPASGRQQLWPRLFRLIEVILSTPEKELPVKTDFIRQVHYMMDSVEMPKSKTKRRAKVGTA